MAVVKAFSLSAEIAAKLEEYALKTKRRESAIVREALKLFFESKVREEVTRDDSSKPEA